MGSLTKEVLPAELLELLYILVLNIVGAETGFDLTLSLKADAWPTELLPLAC